MNQWSELAGNRRLKEQLSIQEEGRGLSHAYILCGPKGSGRHTLARPGGTAALRNLSPLQKSRGGDPSG